MNSRSDSSYYVSRKLDRQVKGTIICQLIDKGANQTIVSDSSDKDKVYGGVLQSPPVLSGSMSVD